MIVQQIEKQKPFTTKDGSTIRSILDRTNAPVEKQSLAEANLPAGQATERHYHKLSEELYFLLEGKGHMELNGESREVVPGDAILIPPVSNFNGFYSNDLSYLLKSPTQLCLFHSLSRNVAIFTYTT